LNREEMQVVGRHSPQYVTVAAGFVPLYPPYNGAPPIGACRGAKPLCVSSYPPRLGARGLTDEQLAAPPARQAHRMARNGRFRV